MAAVTFDRDHIGRRLDSLVQCALHQRTIRLACRECPNVRLLDAMPLWYLFERRGWSGVLNDVPRRFYCQCCWQGRCRRVTRPDLIVCRDRPDNGKQFDYPDERTWKRLVSRYRS